MKKLRGKIILVDKEKYEKNLLEIALLQKKWVAQVEYFPNAVAALKYLKETKDRIFLVISDMDLPEMSGLDFKRIMDDDPKLNIKSIPFIFASNSATKQSVAEAYAYRLQGYFKKPLTIEGQAEMLDIIIRYWIISRHPDIKDEKKIPLIEEIGLEKSQDLFL
jgi:CheY-like chemotaxis protein